MVQSVDKMSDEVKEREPSEPRMDRSAFSVFNSFAEAEAAHRVEYRD